MVFFKSEPVQNALSPAPVSTTQRTASSPAARCHAACNSSRVSGSMAFIASGRFSVTMATPARNS